MTVTFGTAPALDPANPRTCARCKRPELPEGKGHQARRRLITIGQLLEMSPAGSSGRPEHYHPLWVDAYCRSRDCVIAALLDFARSQLYTKFHTGHGLRKDWKGG